jgi:hypothetical protein
MMKLYNGSFNPWISLCEIRAECLIKPCESWMGKDFASGRQFLRSTFNLFQLD